MISKSKLPELQASYEVALKEVNDLRQQMFNILANYQRACFRLVKARSRLKARGRKEGVDIPTPVWWERDDFDSSTLVVMEGLKTARREKG
jgi:hypothetical protein